MLIELLEDDNVGFNLITVLCRTFLHLQFLELWRNEIKNIKIIREFAFWIFDSDM